MIHTVQFYTNLSFDEKREIESRFNKNIEEVLKEASNNKCFTISGVNRKLYYSINIIADITKILNRGDIYEDDYYVVQQKIDDFITSIVGYSIDLTLIRIDYRFDKKINSESEKFMLIHIYKKMIHKYGFKIMKNKDEYETSITYDSKSMQVIIYDKDQEREDKDEEIEDYEKGVLRFEVKLLNRHLNYNKRKYGTCKNLKNYFSESLQKEYMAKNIRKIVYKGDYYNLYKADKIIKQSNIKEKDKLFIREFLVDVSNHSIAGVRNLEGKYTEYKFKKAIKILEELNINPILIPKNKKSLDGKGYSYIKNPFEI